MALGQRTSPQPLTAIASGVAGGFELGQKRQQKAAEFELKKSEETRKQQEFGLKQKEADIQTLGEFNKRINALADQSPEQANTLIQDFKSSEEGQRILKENNLQNINLQILANGERVLSGEDKITEENRSFYENLGKQVSGVAPNLQVGDTVEFLRSPEKKTFDIDRLEKFEEELKVLEIQLKTEELNKKVRENEDSIKGEFSTNDQETIFDRVDTLNKRESFKKASAQLSAASNARALVNTLNPIADAALPVTLARLTGEVGNLAIQEQTRFKSAQDIRSRLNQMIETAKTGKLSDENRELIRDLVEVFEGNARTRLSKQIDLTKKNLSSVAGIAGERIDKIFNNIIEANVITDPINFDTGEKIELGGDTQKTQVSPQNQGALDFIKNNPDDPRTPQIEDRLRRLGVL